VHTLQRRLGVAGAAAIGVASMLGAGIFFVWAPATAAAGAAVLIALPLAAVIAVLNATSTTRLAMRHPTSGGAYAFGRAELGDAAGFTAGILFLSGKTASVAAIGLIAGGYLWPGSERWVAVALIVVLAAINATGVRTTAVVSAAVAAVVIVVLLTVLGAAWITDAEPAALGWPAMDVGTAAGIATATALIFFSFAGYARIATLAEEVRNPSSTLPRAVILSVSIVLALSAVTLAVLLSVLGTDGLAASASPVAAIAAPGFAPVLRAVVALACIGSMLSVLAGLSRTAMAMSRDRELPGPLARVSARTRSPVVAEIVVAVAAIAAVLLVDAAAAVGFSACAVLLYYLIAHLAAVRAGTTIGLPRAIPVAGAIGCLVIALSVPWQAIVGVVAVVVASLAVRALVRGRRRA
jgi:APA family basic amino acid/polyamine antiporter